MDEDKARRWAVNKPKLENIIENMRTGNRSGSMIRPASDKKARIKKLTRGYWLEVPVNMVFVNTDFAQDKEDVNSNLPYASGVIAPNNSRSSWYIVNADIYIPGEELNGALLEHNDENRVLYSADRLYEIIESIGKNAGARGITTEPIQDEHRFKMRSLQDLGYKTNQDGSYSKRL
ncbi:MAG: hypothetical protein ACLFTR_03305 [Candidatus Woesearchaeota archaeon]